MVMMGALLELTHTMAKETAFAVLKMKVRTRSYWKWIIGPLMRGVIASASRSRSDLQCMPAKTNLHTLRESHRSISKLELCKCHGCDPSSRTLRGSPDDSSLRCLTNWEKCSWRQITFTWWALPRRASVHHGRRPCREVA